MASSFYYDNTQTWATTSSTAAGPYQTWYYYDDNGELIQGVQPPQHTHTMPSHNHNNLDSNWRIQPQIHTGLSMNGEEIMKYNGNVEFKMDGGWISIDEINLRIKTLEMITEKLYNLLPAWQRKIINMDEMDPEDKEEEFEHLDPDLFKV